MKPTLYYAHDPMCSWCWAFRPAWDHVCDVVGDTLEVIRLLGGLAPDSSDPMPQPMREMLEDTWRNIQVRVPGTDFNFDFWTDCEPRRSTYPACRAVIAASRQGAEYHEAMTRAIQRAYYLAARNPSDDSTLVELAAELGLDAARFRDDLDSAAAEDEFARHRAACRQLNIHGFPTLLVHREGIVTRIPVEFNEPELQVKLIMDAAS